jgi:23S rRNA (cytidine1920-2'-O)/16S rRNA (cytidine1409-2'-O)-methyltransferase
MPKIRLDLLLVERSLAESRAKAQALVMAGQVRVDGQVVIKPATTVDTQILVDVASGPRYVSRGGDKLEAALTTFPITVQGRTCADVGASTGGFSDCLLQNGAAKIYAIDVGKGILHWKLRSNPRVIVMEETNARYVESLPEPVSLIVCDASFISLKILLPVIMKWLAPPPFPERERGSGGLGGLIALIKPQFEAGRKESAKHKGVIRDPEIHRRILLDILTFAEATGFSVRGLTRSPVLGPKGNVEFLAWFQPGEEKSDLEAMVTAALPKEDGSPQMASDKDGIPR